MFSSTRYIICGYHRARLFWNEAIEIYRYPRATPSIFFNLAISRIFFFSLNVFFFFPEANVTRNSFIILSSVHQLLGKRGNYPSQLPITITKQILGHHLEENFHFLSQLRFKLCKFKLSLQNSSFFFHERDKNKAILSNRITIYISIALETWIFEYFAGGWKKIGIRGRKICFLLWKTYRRGPTWWSFQIQVLSLEHSLSRDPYSCRLIFFLWRGHRSVNRSYPGLRSWTNNRFQWRPTICTPRDPRGPCNREGFASRIWPVRHTQWNSRTRFHYPWQIRLKIFIIFCIYF